MPVLIMARTRRGAKKKSVDKGDKINITAKPKSRAGSAAKTKPKKPNSETEDDDDFELTTEMMVHDFDDETTIWEEEQMSEGAYQEELENLEKDNQMSIDELREHYARLQENYEREQKLSNNNKIKKNLDAGAIEDDDEYVPKKSYYQSDKKNNKNLQNLETIKVLPSRSKRIASRQLPRYVFGSDYDYSDDDDDSREVKIGDDHQAYTAPIYYTLDIYPPNPFPVHPRHLQWSPFVTTQKNVENYFNELNKYPSYSTQPAEDYALAHFYKYKCNIGLAIENIDELIVSIDNSFLDWNVKDCEDFEKGIQEYGKDFYSIRQHYLPHKPHCEIIQFYYIWKKSERADQFVVKLKEKSKSKRFLASVFDYLENVMADKKLPYKLSEDGIHYELDDVD